METNVFFKKFETIGTTKDEAMKKVDLNLRVDATQAYNKWVANNAVTEDSLKEWMKDYLNKKKFTMPKDGAYIVLQSAITDTRERPYKENKPKYDARTHTFERVYVLRAKDTGSEVGCEKTSKAAIQAAKEFVSEEHVGVDIFVEAKIKEKNSLYTTIDYVPSKGTRPCKLLVFGYQVVD